MNHLVVFCGPSACGKSTLIGKILEQYQDFDFIDIFNYVQKYKDETGHIEPAGSLKAHQEMHQDLSLMDKI